MNVGLPSFTDPRDDVRVIKRYEASPNEGVSVLIITNNGGVKLLGRANTAALLSQVSQSFIYFCVNIGSYAICVRCICALHVCMCSLVVRAGLPVPVITI